MSGGFVGKYAVVDLSSRTTEICSLPASFFQRFLSGYGLGAAVITQRQAAGLAPLSPEAHLGLCSGLLTGTGVPFSGRFMAVGKSPLTGTWGDANGGGYLSREMKRAGFDAIFFRGRSDTPCWVSVCDGTIEIRDARNLWGGDTLATEGSIRKEMADGKAQVACIGVAGEKRSLISGIVTDGGRIAARSGLGALMGSKNLKAVAFRGMGTVSVARPQDVKEITARLMAEFKSPPRMLDKLSLRFMDLVSRLIARTGLRFPAEPCTVREIWKRWGTCGTTVYSALIGDMPIRNWDGAGTVDYTFEMADRLSAENVVMHQEKRYACQSCPLGCGGIVEIPSGRYGGTRGHKPEYETLAAFGGLLMHDDLEAVFELNEMCNRAGIDTISTGGTVAFAIECFENGLLDKEMTGGLAPGWGTTREIIRLTEMIINREGFGDILADGVRVAAAKLGKGAERFAVHAGGQELPMHDSRLDPGYTIAYACEPTPGRHTIASFLDIDLRSGRDLFPAARRMAKAASGKQARQVAQHTATSIYAQIINCAGLCVLGADSTHMPTVDYLNAVTGWDLAADDYFKAGRRILALRKAFNIREGVRAEDTRLHDRALGKPPQAKGPLKGRSVEAGPLQEAYYRFLGFDPETGAPTDDTMEELEIAHLFG